jgi:uncharacterized damage-inducible protein DinB
MPKLPKPAKKTTKTAANTKPVKTTKTAKKVAAIADPRYPVGKFAAPASIQQKDVRKAIKEIAELPKALRKSLRKLSDKKLNTPYREGGWTVRQLVHHVADSHMTAFHRVRKALTEDAPLVTGYDEKAFAELADSAAPVEWSLDAIEGTHGRWVMLLESMPEKDFERSFQHAERGPMTLAYATLLYAWHSKHHVAHITALRKQKGW